MHLSRIGEEIVLWSSQEFGFVELDDAFATGSSMMPQKKNPDMAELVRGKSARVIGDLVALLMLQKGLPLGYNRDLQEDKTPDLRRGRHRGDLARGAGRRAATANFRVDRMRAALGAGFVTATEVADYLAARGVPFREAHEITGRLVREAMARGVPLHEVPVAVMRGFHPPSTRRCWRCSIPRWPSSAGPVRRARRFAGEAGHRPSARNPGPSDKQG